MRHIEKASMRNISFTFLKVLLITAINLEGTGKLDFMCDKFICIVRGFHSTCSVPSLQTILFSSEVREETDIAHNCRIMLIGITSKYGDR
jgi:hypothetical protein